MGVRNFLIEGVSCAGKTSVGRALARRGYHVVHGDDELAYQGDPITGEPTDGARHENHIWDVGRVRAIAADRDHQATFFCGGSRNFSHFIDLFDEVFVLEVDLETLNRRLAARPDDEWGVPASIGAANARLQHASREDLPAVAISIDATLPLEQVVDSIIARTL